MSDNIIDNITKENGKKESSEKTIHDATNSEYKYGFTSDIDTEIAPPGLNEDIIRVIAQKNEARVGRGDFRV